MTPATFPPWGLDYPYRSQGDYDLSARTRRGPYFLRTSTSGYQLLSGRPENYMPEFSFEIHPCQSDYGSGCRALHASGPAA
jgi:hypothetical protein